MSKIKVLAHASLVLSSMLLVSPSLYADTQAAAEAFFHAGRAAAKRGDMREACAKFRESHRLDAAVGTRLNLAVCEAELGHLAVSWQLLTSLAKALPAADPRLAVVRERLAAVESRLPRVTLEAAERLPPGITVRTGQLEIGESGFGVPIPLDPGKYSFEVTAPGFVPSRYELTFAEGDTQTLRVTAPRREAEPSRPSVSRGIRSGFPPARPRDLGSRSLRTWTILTFGGAGMALASGVATGLAALERKETMSDACDRSGCTDEGVRAAQSGDTLAQVSTASFLTGVALASAGTLLLILGPATGPEPSKRASAPASIHVALSAGGLAVRGRL